MVETLNEQLVKKFEKKTTFERAELFDFLNGENGELKENTFRWRIYDLKKKGIIKQVKRGRFTISKKQDYEPLISNDLIKLSKIVTAKYEGLDYCIWPTQWLNDFTQHQLGRFFTVLEVEKDFVESVFENYMEVKNLRVFLYSPDLDFSKYASLESILIIKPLVGRSPKANFKTDSKTKRQIKVPTLEKILVDVFCDKKLFFAVQGNEMKHIYKNALERFNIDFTKLLSYAKRRGREEQLVSFLKSHFPNQTNPILK